MYKLLEEEMEEKLLRKKDIAERLNCGWKKARTLLADHGVHPIDYGAGRSGGQRWLESAVNAAILAMHQQAQPAKKKARLQPCTSSLAAMSAGEIFKLVANQNQLQ